MHRGRGVGSSDDLSCLIPAGTIHGDLSLFLALRRTRTDRLLCLLSSLSNRWNPIAGYPIACKISIVRKETVTKARSTGIEFFFFSHSHSCHFISIVYEISIVRKETVTTLSKMRRAPELNFFFFNRHVISEASSMRFRLFRRKLW